MLRAVLLLPLVLLTACEVRLGTGMGEYPAGVRVYEYAKTMDAQGHTLSCTFNHRSGTEATGGSFDLYPCGDEFKGAFGEARAFEGQRNAIDLNGQAIAAREARRQELLGILQTYGPIVACAAAVTANISLGAACEGIARIAKPPRAQPSAPAVPDPGESLDNGAPAAFSPPHALAPPIMQVGINRAGEVTHRLLLSRDAGRCTYQQEHGGPRTDSCHAYDAWLARGLALTATDPSA